MEKKRYNAGQVIFNVGDAADGLYLIASGSVGVYFPGNLSSNKPDITLKETEIIGEMGVIDSELRTATARAYSEVDVIHVTKEDFEKKLAETDIIIRGVVAVLSDRLRQLQKRRVGQELVSVFISFLIYQKQTQSLFYF